MNVPEWFFLFSRSLYPTSFCLFTFLILIWIIGNSQEIYKCWLLTMAIMVSIFVPFILPIVPSWESEKVVVENFYNNIPNNQESNLPKEMPENAFLVSHEKVKSNFDFIFWLYVIWITVFSILMLKTIVGYIFLIFWERKQQDAELSLQEHLDILLKKYNIKKRVILKITTNNISPTTIGFTKHIICLPKSILKNFSLEKLDFILLHEIAHIERMDTLWIFFQRLAESIYFFHPLIWIISLHLSRCRENVCDDYVIKCNRNPIGYTKAIFDFLEFNSLSSCSAYFLNPYQEIKQRINRILTKENIIMNKYLCSIISLIAIVIFLSSLFFWGGYSSVQAQDQAEIEVIPQITGDFPANERIDPEVITLNGKDVRTQKFAPGKYILLLSQPGYYLLKQDILLTKDTKPYILKRTLVTQPRLIEEKISYDVEPSKHLAPHIITFVNGSQKEIVVKNGMMIKPDSYKMYVKKEGYETIEMKKHVWPSDKPLIIDVKLISKLITLEINVSYDINPIDPQKFMVSLMDSTTSITRLISSGRKIKPGTYTLNIIKSGYEMAIDQGANPILIEPSEKPYIIQKKLITSNKQTKFPKDSEVDKNKRSLSFSMLYNGELVPAYNVLVNGETCNFRSTFDVGSELQLTIKFKKYKTINQAVKVEPGEGPFIIKLDLEPLTCYEFMYRRKAKNLDGIEYPLEFSIDKKMVESHLINQENSLNRFYYQIWAPNNAQNLRVYFGYLFAEKPIQSIKTLPNFNNIDIVRLIKHLDQKENAIQILQKMVKENKDMFKNLSSEEIKLLVAYIQTQKSEQAQDILNFFESIK